ncbi:MAG: hypothetical protein ACE5GX_03585 [Thermoanaerobaculia bacterium]
MPGVYGGPRPARSFERICSIERTDGKTGWSRLRAVQEDPVWPVEANGCFSRPGPRLAESIDELAAAFHGYEPTLGGPPE